MASPARGTPRTNFGYLEAHDEQHVRLGMLAEGYFTDDPERAAQAEAEGPARRVPRAKARGQGERAAGKRRAS